MNNRKRINAKLYVKQKKRRKKLLKILLTSTIFIIFLSSIYGGQKYLLQNYRQTIINESRLRAEEEFVNEKNNLYLQIEKYQNIINDIKLENEELRNKITEQQKENELLKEQINKRTVSSRSSTSKSTKWTVGNMTAYCSCSKCCGKYANGITAMGTIATAGRTVAASKQYPLGTKIEIEGYGIYIVEDRGGAITDNKIDIYMNSHTEALNFGRKKINFRVIE